MSATWPASSELHCVLTTESLYRMAVHGSRLQGVLMGRLARRLGTPTSEGWLSLFKKARASRLTLDEVVREGAELGRPKPPPRPPFPPRIRRWKGAWLCEGQVQDFRYERGLGWSPASAYAAFVQNSRSFGRSMNARYE